MLKSKSNPVANRKAVGDQSAKYGKLVIAFDSIIAQLSGTTLPADASDEIKKFKESLTNFGYTIIIK